MVATQTKQATGLSVAIGMIKQLSNEIELLKCFSHEEVYATIKKRSPKLVIFQAMSFSYHTLLECKRMFPNVEICAHLHSKFPFLGVESSPVTFIERCISHGIKIIFNNRDALNMFPFENCLYLPNVYTAPRFIPTPLFNSEKKIDSINIGCHGSMRHMKNHVVQAAAACRLAKKLNKKLYFHVNTTRDDGELKFVQGSLQKVLRMHGAEMVECNWMDHREFVSYCSNLDLGMQISLCETFNLVAADYVTAGIPIVVSPEIDWVTDESKASTSDISEIISKMEQALENKSLIEVNKNCLVDHNIKAVYDWKVFLSNYLEGVPDEA